MVRRKLRDIERDLMDAGFRPIASRGKGSHTLWLHQPTGAQMNLPRPKGDLLPDYVDREAQEAIRKSRVLAEPDEK